MKKSLSILFFTFAAFSVLAQNDNIVAADININENVLRLKQTPLPSVNPSAAPYDYMQQVAEAGATIKDRLNSTTPKVSKARKADDAEFVAGYLPPAGTLFTGVERNGSLYTLSSIIGSWGNNVPVWEWKNTAKGYENIDYMTAYGYRYGEEFGWSIGSNGSFIDTTMATSKGMYGYYSSIRRPLQTVTRTVGKGDDAVEEKLLFELVTGPDLEEERDPDNDTIINEREDLYTWLSDVYTFAGMPNVFTYYGTLDDGMWPLTNAIIPVRDKEWYDNVDYLLPDRSSYMYSTSAYRLTYDDGTTASFNPAYIRIDYDKPQSPLYIRDVTIPMFNIENRANDYAPILGGTVIVSIMNSRNRVIATATATADNIGDRFLFGGNVLNVEFKTTDDYGRVNYGVTVNEAFSLVIAGLNQSGNDFIIWCTGDPLNRHKTHIYDTNNRAHDLPASYDPLVMLNGIYNTLEDGYGLTSEYEYHKGDTIDLMFTGSAGVYTGRYIDGEARGYVPAICASYLLVDTVLQCFNYEVSAKQCYTFDYVDFNGTNVDSYWEDLGMYGLVITLDEENIRGEQPAVGDIISLSQYGQTLVYRVAELPAVFSGLENTQQDFFARAMMNDGMLRLLYDDNFTTADVYSASGMLIGSYALPRAEQTTINMQSVPSGVYMIQLQGKQTTTLRVVK